MAGYLTWSNLLLRTVMVFVLVVLTYNPSGFSYVGWLADALEQHRAGAPHAFAGVVVVIGWVFLVRATLRSLGLVGLILGAAFFGTLLWLLISFHVLRLDAENKLSWAALLCLAGLLSVGLSWSHIRRHLTGQVDVDEIDR
ncbi:MAG TPA: DUF6524 family protein [Gammaproteobacteria bacterium]|nr:DUF6524 family protein [Gammaproteobacteria bacterium]